MKVELVKLYNTLKTVETKGDHTLTMADCLRFLEQLIAKEQENNKEATSEAVEVTE